MIKLRQAQWDILLRELEMKATGATIHDIRLKYSWTKDRIEMYCMYHDKPDKEIEIFDAKGKRIKYMLHKSINEDLQDAIKQLKIYGYDDYKDFIEEG